MKTKMICFIAFISYTFYLTAGDIYVSPYGNDKAAGTRPVSYTHLRENDSLIHSGKVNYMFLEIDKKTRAQVQPIGK